MAEPRKYRKRPVEVEATQYVDAESGTAIIQRILDAGGSAQLWCSEPDEPDHGGHTIRILTVEGDVHASFGDWIIRDAQGEFYPCKPDVFEQTYEDPAKAEPHIAQLIEVSETDVVVDGQSIGGWIAAGPIEVEHVENGPTVVLVKLVAKTVRTTVHPHPENRPENR